MNQNSLTAPVFPNEHQQALDLPPPTPRVRVISVDQIRNGSYFLAHLNLQIGNRIVSGCRLCRQRGRSAYVLSPDGKIYMNLTQAESDALVGAAVAAYRQAQPQEPRRMPSTAFGREVLHLAGLAMEVAA